MIFAFFFARMSGAVACPQQGFSTVLEEELMDLQNQLFGSHRVSESIVAQVLGLAELVANTSRG